MSPSVTPAAAVPFRVLYLFAGKARRADFGDALASVVAEWNQGDDGAKFELILDQIDTLRGGLEHDMLDVEAREKILAKIRAGQYDLVLVAPPCNTFSRAVFREGPGPKPIRSKQWPRGFPWLGVMPAPGPRR